MTVTPFKLRFIFKIFLFVFIKTINLPTNLNSGSDARYLKIYYHILVCFDMGFYHVFFHIDKNKGKY